MSVALLVAAACCVGAVAGAVWDQEAPRDNPAGMAHETLLYSTNAKAREQAVTCVANEAIDAIEALKVAAKSTDRAGAHAREYLVQLSRFAGDGGK